MDTKGDQEIIHPEIIAFNKNQEPTDVAICNALAKLISEQLPEAKNKIWHRHPVWFLDENPIVGYSKQKAGIRLMFWSGASFQEENLKPGTGKFKDASVFFNGADEIQEYDLIRWLHKARDIQWDYKNIYKRKGELLRLK
jgi:hypothetical protein